MNELPPLRRSPFRRSNFNLRMILSILLLVSSCGGRTNLEQISLVPNVDLGKSVQRAGTRLVPLAWVSSDGPTIYSRRFYDLQRSEQCKFALADDGSYRCFPIAITAYLATSWVSTFANEQCTDLVIPEVNVSWYPREFPLYPDPRYFAIVNEHGCDTGRQTYELPRQRSSTVYVKDGAVCEEFAFMSHYAPGRRVANSEFASGMNVVASLHEAQLGLHQITSTDGAAAIVGLYDRADEIACEPQRISGTEARCVGAPVLQPSSFDADRTMVDGVRCNVLVTSAAECTTPRYGAVTNNDETTIHRVRAFSEIEQPSSAQSACVDTMNLEPGANACAIADEVPIEHFPKLEYRSIDERRIQWRDRQTIGPQGQVALPIFDDETLSLFDSNINLDCTLMPATDDKLRCLPNWWQKLSYANADCSEQLLESNGDGVPYPYYTLGRKGGPHPVVTVGAPYAGKVYEIQFGISRDNGCNPVAVHSTSKWYLIGAEAPPDRFAEYRLEQMP